MKLPHIHWFRLWNERPLIFKCRCGVFWSPYGFGAKLDPTRVEVVMNVLFHLFDGRPKHNPMIYKIHALEVIRALDAHDAKGEADG